LSEIPTNIINPTVLLIVAYVCVGIGAVGMILLWFVWRRNYVWILNKIFLYVAVALLLLPHSVLLTAPTNRPGFLNSLAGLLSTLVNIYSTPPGSVKWTESAKITVCIMGGCMVVTGTLFVIYDLWILRNVKSKHARQMAARSGKKAERAGKNFFSKIISMALDSALDSALDPESVV
jgi:hypothetical protein